jgi:hypothetical protein
MCKGSCGHVSGDGPGMCSSEGCTNQGQPFEACDCGDSAHGKKSDSTMDASPTPTPMSPSESPPPADGPTGPTGM